MKLQTNKKRGLMFIILSVAIAGIAGVASYVTFDQVYKSVPVLVAKTEISPGDPLNAKMFDKKEVPIGAVKGTGALVPGCDMDGLVSTKGMLAGDILRKENTVNMQDRDLSVLSTRLSTTRDMGLLAVDVPIESVKGMLDGMKAWDKVCIGVSWSDKDKELNIGTKNAQYVTEIIVEDATVIGLRKPQEGGAGALIVGLDSAQFLKYMESKEKGSIYVALRPLGYGNAKAEPQKKPESQPLQTTPQAQPAASDQSGEATTLQPTPKPVSVVTQP